MHKRKDRSQIEMDITLRAWSDPAFKKKLIEHPKEALSEFGLDVPSHAKIHVHEEHGDTWHFTLRKMPPNAKKLSREQLENRSAGGSIGPPTCS